MARKQLKKKGRVSFRDGDVEPKVAHLKPARFQHYLTIGELARQVDRDVSWLKKLEREGRIPEGIRHTLGQIEVRLYSPARVQEITRILSTLRPGRPRKGG